MAGVYAAIDFWWTWATSTRSPRCSSTSSRRSTATSRNGARNAGYMQIALWADAVERAGTFYPPEVIKAYEAGKQERTRPSARSPGAPPTTSSSGR